MIHEVVEANEVYSAVRLMATARWLGLLLGPAVGLGSCSCSSRFGASS